MNRYFTETITLKNIMDSTIKVARGNLIPFEGGRQKAS